MVDEVMKDTKTEEIAAGIDRLAGTDLDALTTYLDQHEEQLRQAGEFKLLALANYRAKRILKAHRFLRRVSAHELDDAETRIAAQIRQKWRKEKRLRLGLYIPSEKRFSRRIIDGAVNIMRHGTLRDPTSNSARTPSHLREVSGQIRLSRNDDVSQLRSLLDRHEIEFREAGNHKFLALNYYHAGCLSKAADYARDLDPKALSTKEKIFVANILFEERAWRRLLAGEAPLSGFLEPNTKAPRRKAPARPRALYLAASSWPFILSGYTSRSEALVRAMRECDNFELVPTTRPGFPGDRSDAKNVPKSSAKPSTFDIITSKSPFRGDLESYLEDVLPRLELHARDNEVDIVHAVSNYRNGVIGLALARRMGMPFVYEVRGLWEETTDTKLVGWRETERFQFERLFEQYLYEVADGVLTINDQVRDILEIRARGNVEILPNCVSRSAIMETVDRPSGLPLSIGYVGSLLEYEGLDDLIQAVARLQAQGADLRLDIYGKGKDRQRLEELIDGIVVSNVVLHGEVDPSEVPSLYRRFDLCVFPRKPYRVCQLVTPLKPIEAIANDVNVIVSDVAPMAHLVSGGGALAFAAGSTDSLTSTISAFIEMDASERTQLRSKAKALVSESFVWERQCSVISKVYGVASRSHHHELTSDDAGTRNSPESDMPK